MSPYIKDSGQLQKILLTLKELEQAVSELYQSFAQEFTADPYFWLTLSSQEDNHAAIMEKIGAAAAQNPQALQVSSALKFETLKTMLEYIKITHAGLQHSPMKLEQALKLALDLEQSVLGTKIYGHITLSDARLTQLLEVLQRQTEDHARQLELKIRELKPGAQH